MKNIRKGVILIGVLVLMLSFGACAENKLEEEAKEPTKKEVKEVELTQQYTTKFGDVNAITYPAFTFGYPEGWIVAEESVDQMGETVVLKNENGVEVKYFMSSGDISGGSAVDMVRVEATEEAKAEFVPGAVQASNHTDMGEFVVAKLKVTGHMDMQSGSELEAVDGAVSYGLLPKSQLGVREDVIGPFEGEYAFDYSSHISFIASAPESGFTEQDRAEAVKILASFKCAE